MIILGVGDFNCTGEPGGVLKTFALGSCVALLLWDEKSKTAGMAHIVLPSSATNPKRAALLPGYFADCAVPALMQSMKAKCGGGNGFVAKLAGGANIMKTQTTFNIGQRNVEAVREELKKYRMAVRADDILGNISRTVTIESATGVVTIASPGYDSWTI